MDRIITAFLLVLFLVSFLIVPELRAQSADGRVETSDRMQQLQRIMEREDELFERGADTVPADVRVDDAGDFGRQRILRRRSAHKYYFGSASLTTQTSDNATLVPSNRGPASDANRVAGVSGGYNFNLPSPYTARLSGSYQAVKYQDLDALNYDYAILSGNVRRQLPSNLGRNSVNLGYRYQNLMYGAENENNSRTDSVQRQHVLNAGLRKLIPLSRYRLISTGLTLENEITSHVDRVDPFSGKAEGGEFDPEKTRFILNSTYRYQYSRRISWNASYQFRRDWYRYQNNFGLSGDRLDYTHVGSLGLGYRWSDSVNLSLGTSYSENHSNFATNEYDSFSASFLISTRTQF